MFKKIAILVVVVALSQAVNASNPADLTLTKRYCPREMYKATDDVTTWWTSATIPVKSESSLTWYEWRTTDGEKCLRELTVSKKFSSELQTALILGNREGGEPSSQSLMIDFSADNLSLGVIAPIDQLGDSQIGPRWRMGKFTAFLTTAQDSKPFYGLSFAEKGLSLDLAVKEETWFFRASKPCGQITPELRCRFTESENYFGFGITYYPK